MRKHCKCLELSSAQWVSDSLIVEFVILEEVIGWRSFALRRLSMVRSNRVLGGPPGFSGSWNIWKAPFLQLGLFKGNDIHPNLALYLYLRTLEWTSEQKAGTYHLLNLSGWFKVLRVLPYPLFLSDVFSTYIFEFFVWMHILGFSYQELILNALALEFARSLVWRWRSCHGEMVLETSWALES